MTRAICRFLVILLLFSAPIEAQQRTLWATKGFTRPAEPRLATAAPAAPERVLSDLAAGCTAAQGSSCSDDELIRFAIDSTSLGGVLIVDRLLDIHETIIVDRPITIRGMGRGGAAGFLRQSRAADPLMRLVDSGKANYPRVSDLVFKTFVADGAGTALEVQAVGSLVQRIQIAEEQGGARELIAFQDGIHVHDAHEVVIEQSMRVVAGILRGLEPG